MALKEKISSPLEAGPSILDAHHLPPHLTSALEYTSSRLAKKSLHLTLVVVRRDYQLPAILPSHVSPGLYSPMTPGSPPVTGGSVGSSRLAFASSPVIAFKKLVRSASQRVSKRSNETPRGGLVSPGYPPTSALESPRLRWPLSPTTPLSPPPMTPSTTTSITTTETNGPPTPNSSSLRFFYASDMSPTAEKVMKSTISKAGIKYGLGSAWLAPFASTSARELTNQLFQNSVVQNEILFSSDECPLELQQNKLPLRLEDAVDELRRFILASNGAKISRSDLFRSYDWLSVSSHAITELDLMYRRAYGGPERFGGISGMPMPLEKIPEPGTYQPLMSSFDDDSTDDGEDDDYNDGDLSPSDTILDPNIIGVAITAMHVIKPPTPRRIGPQLKLQTNFEHKSKLKARRGEDEDGDRTARPADRSAQAWNSRSTIDQVLSAQPLTAHPLTAHPLTAHPLSSHPITSYHLSPDRGTTKVGPTTPNGYDDISPITRGEWGFLMVDNGFKGGGRTAAVETC
ncbi:hypothetical protein PT974_10552 [Cladobotryum mycophilum]|uniref:DUF7582 domain-containing protein n=1 Tax=Cladobotryum mycophilum TaxID=491253 RepID=A0ABR0SA66_9HYPO